MSDKDVIFHLGHRQTGRTTELIRWLREGADAGKKYMIIVHSQAEAERVYEEAKKWYDERDIQCPIEKWQVNPVDRPQHGRDIDEVAIDNLELLLWRLTGPFPLTHVYATRPYETDGRYIPGIIVEDEL